MSIHAHPTRPNEPGRNVPGRGTRINASSQDDGAPPLSLAERVRLERQGDRLAVTIMRRYPRLFTLSDAEALYLAELIADKANVA